MGINLALSRISKLLNVLGNPHASCYKSIHIAGTNGKGSTVAYLSAILTEARIRNGRFTSPHMIQYNDCISINNQTYPTSKFEKVASMVQQQNSINKFGCTEFEVLTVTAFKIFELEQVEFAVIEVGLGGRLDATNALAPASASKGGVVVCGITKIGIDHESFLGDTLAAIAGEKAGIMKEDVPCVLDGTNKEEVVSVIEEKALELRCELTIVNGLSPREKALRLLSPLQGEYQSQNLGVALKVIEALNRHEDTRITTAAIELGVKNVTWPGRLQKVTIDGLELLIDGAHNESAATELGKYLRTYRDNSDGLIFIVAMSKGKSVSNLFKYIADKDADTLLPCEFTCPEGMPWVKPFVASKIAEEGHKYFKNIIQTSDNSVISCIQKLKELRSKNDTRKVVVCGSLYLCADVLRHQAAQQTI